MQVTAIARRSGDWWAVEVPEVDGAFTQAKRLEQIPAMVADAISLLEDIPAEQVEVTVVPDIGDPELLESAERARAQVAAAQAVQAAAASASRAVVEQLRDKGLPVRDVAVILKMSAQRVSQLDGGSATRSGNAESTTRDAKTGRVVAKSGAAKAARSTKTGRTVKSA
ncbi:type II toxin-antitoxin system HicB family antitoxin [Nocardia bovistercoris]|uniref:type II toxin-antitoxin system HicB family antitoxin n=1 Tax=Nocardia bovistercoris TaxID=2785916 RepID=UPI002FCCFEE4